MLFTILCTCRWIHGHFFVFYLLHICCGKNRIIYTFTILSVQFTGFKTIHICNLSPSASRKFHFPNVKLNGDCVVLSSQHWATVILFSAFECHCFGYVIKMEACHACLAYSLSMVFTSSIHIVAWVTIFICLKVEYMPLCVHIMLSWLIL